MPNISSYIKLLLAAVVSTIGICTSCKEYDDLDTQSPDITPNISIRQLREYVTEKAVTIDQELIIGGYVTSCDKAGNFYRTFTFEDTTAGVEVMAGLYDLHNIYPQGYYVTINLKGCTAAIHNGTLQIGRKADSYSNYPIDYFYTRLLLDYHVATHDIYQPIIPAEHTIGSLSEEWCGRLISLNSLRLCSNDHLNAWDINTEGKWSGYNVFCNTNGDMIIVHTSEYATYAQYDIPTDEVTLTGILQRSTFDGRKYFFIKMRNEKDCCIYN